MRVIEYNGESLLNPNGLFLTKLSGCDARMNIETERIIQSDASILKAEYAEERVITIQVLLRNDKEKELFKKTFPKRTEGEFVYIRTDKPKYKDKYARSIKCRVRETSITYNRPYIGTAYLVCLSPQFERITETVYGLCGEINLWEFPFELPEENEFEFSNLFTSGVATIENGGDVTAGFKAEIDVLYENVGDIRLSCSGTGEYVALRGSFLAGDSIVINTNEGQKGVTLSQLENDRRIEREINQYVEWGSTFFQIPIGSSRIRITSSNNNGIRAAIYFTERFDSI